MKRIFWLLMVIMLLTGCGIEDNSSDEVDVIDSTYSDEKQVELIGSFEKAVYSKYNSYASENGLGDTLIYIEGKVLNQTKIENSDSEAPTLALVIEQEDGNRWAVGIPTFEDKDILNSFTGENVRVFGTYTGYSDVFNLPAIVVGIEDANNYDKARVEIEENGEYTTIWNFYDDYVKNVIEKSEENETAEENIENVESEENVESKESEEQSQESTEIYVPTTGERNALKSAKNYLELTAFSYQGLVEQLEYEQYSHDEAIYAADNCGADWNEQAALKAKSYLELTSFSKDGLIEQLEYEGFTHEQAVYGAEQNGY